MSDAELQSLLDAAAAHLSAGRLQAATEAYRAVLAARLEQPLALHGLGWLAHLSGDGATAVDLLRRCLRSDPSAAGCWNNLGIVYAADGRPADAADAYRRAIALQPGFGAAHLNLGNAMRDTGRWGEAVAAYESAVRLMPNLAAAHHAMGTALREVGRPAEALASYRRAIQLDGASAPQVFNDLGVTFARLGNAAEAERHLRQSIALKSTDPKPWRNLGHLLLRTARPAEAAEAFSQLAKLQPDLAEAHHDLGLALAQAARLDEAIEHFRRAIELRAAYPEALCNLGVALEDRGRVAEAAEAYGKALALRPDSAVIAYHHAALAGRGAPPACPPAYLIELFDRYADRFDAHLVGSLHYTGPQLLLGAVTAATSRKDLAVLDLGCGTGLCGVLFRPIAATLVGVDLAPRMIEKARQRRVYDELVRADVVDVMRQRPGSADVVLAADVFIYIGDLMPVFRAARDSLRPGGLLAFTIEVIDDAAGDSVLRPTRRYAQSAGYIRRLSSEVGLEPVSVAPAVLRAGE